ncbi:hypothetical protein BKA80DRAFT_282350 [Phyllosticta citrichinensis]
MRKSEEIRGEAVDMVTTGSTVKRPKSWRKYQTLDQRKTPERKSKGWRAEPSTCFPWNHQKPCNRRMQRDAF